MDEMEWALVKVKGDTISSVTGTTGEMGGAQCYLYLELVGEVTRLSI